MGERGYSRAYEKGHLSQGKATICRLYIGLRLATPDSTIPKTRCFGCRWVNAVAHGQLHLTQMTSLDPPTDVRGSQGAWPLMGTLFTESHTSDCIESPTFTMSNEHDSWPTSPGT